MITVHLDSKASVVGHSLLFFIVLLAGCMACVLISRPAQSQTLDLAAPADTTTWQPYSTLDFNLASIHTEQWARNTLNQINPGLGITSHLTPDFALAIGAYKNSYRHRTVYALVEYTPLHLGRLQSWHVDAGVGAGLATGYTKSEVPCRPFAAAGILRLVAPNRMSLNLMVVPNGGPRDSGFVGFQFGVPIN